jgi:hypothetical protein
VSIAVDAISLTEPLTLPSATPEAAPPVVELKSVLLTWSLLGVVRKSSSNGAIIQPFRTQPYKNKAWE